LLVRSHPKVAATGERSAAAERESRVPFWEEESNSKIIVEKWENYDIKL
jgi:hypothetical protein